jgi:hypothetical protein
MGGSARTLLGRVLLVIAGLFVVGIVLRLIVAVLEPVLPAILMRDLGAGWNFLYGIVAPAMPAVMAILILAAVAWVLTGRR